MKLLAYLRSVTARFFQRAQVEDELEVELRSHIQLRADDLERSGAPRAEAERRARIEFGGRERFKEECRESLGGNSVETFVNDARFSLRVLRKSKGFAAIAVLTLAAAIGANAVAFGVLNGLVIRPLNVPQSETLYGTEYGDGSGWQSFRNYLDLRDRNRSFEELAAWKFVFVAFDTGKDPARATGFAATANYFDVLRLKPHLGRFFHREEDRGPYSMPYIVLTYACWQSRFDGDRGVIGRVVRINKQPYTVIGVAPPGFRGTLLFVSPAFFVPVINQESPAFLNARGNYDAVFEIFGHLKPGVTPAQAIADANSVGDYLRKTYPKEFGSKPTHLSRVGLGVFGGPARAFVTALMALAGLILVAACANLGSLFAAHAADRSREVALRLALGSSRTRILRQLLTEAVLISLTGGAMGLLCSVFLLNWLSTWAPFPMAPIRLPVTPDASVYGLALGLALVSGLLFGIVPVRQVLRTDPYQIVKSGPSGGIGRRVTVREVLLGFQIAICAVLVTSSIVAVRGLVLSLTGKLGFEPRNTMLAGADLSMAGYRDGQLPEMQKRMIRAVETIPGVERVGLVNNWAPLLYGAASRANIFKDETRDLMQSNAFATPYYYQVSPGYFAAAGTSLLAGRGFTWRDDRPASAVVVVNQTFAVTLLGSVTGAIGKHYRMQDGTRVEVVGVVEDGKYLSLTEYAQPAMFGSFLQTPSAMVYLVMRSHRAPLELAAAVRSRLRELDAGMPADIGTWESLLDVARFPSRMAAAALGALGMLGALLSITGISGMAAYSVSRRMKELGIRLALGAQRKEMLHAALGRPFKLLFFGSTAGLLLGILAGRVLASIVYQATPRDPVVLGGVVLSMLLLGLVATWVPAQRALSIDPLRLLREE